MARKKGIHLKRILQEMDTFEKLTALELISDELGLREEFEEFIEEISHLFDKYREKTEEEIQFEEHLVELLRNPVYDYIMSSEKNRQTISQIYKTNASFYRRRIHELDKEKDCIYLSHLNVERKWNVLLLRAITEEYVNTDNYAEFIFKLIKRNNKRIFDYAKNQPLDVERFISSFKTNSSNNDRSLKMQLKLYVYTCILLGHHSHESVLDAVDYTGLMGDSLYEYLESLYHKPLIPNLKEELESDYEIMKQKAYNFYNLLTAHNWKEKDSLSLERFIFLIKWNVGDKFFNDDFINEELFFLTELFESFGANLAQYLQNENISLSFEEWVSICYTVDQHVSYKKFRTDNSLPIMEEKVKLTLRYLILFALNKGAVNIKKEYWQEKTMNEQNDLEDMLDLVREKEKNVKIQEKRFLEKEISYVNKIKEQSDLLAMQAQKIRNMEKLIKSLEKEKEKQVETISMLEEALIAKSETNEDAISTDIYEEELIEKVRNVLIEKEVVLIGGHDNFHIKISRTFPSIKLIKPDDLKIGNKTIYNAEIILYETSYNNHAQWERLKGLKNNQKIIFINNGASVTNTAKLLAESLDLV